MRVVGYAVSAMRFSYQFAYSICLCQTIDVDDRKVEFFEALNQGGCRCRASNSNDDSVLESNCIGMTDDVQVDGWGARAECLVNTVSSACTKTD